MQGVTIKGSYYPLPTLQISSETRSNLAELKLTILSLMSVCSGVPRDDIWVKIRFIMTDSVSYNLVVEELAWGRACSWSSGLSGSSFTDVQQGNNRTLQGYRH